MVGIVVAVAAVAGLAYVDEHGWGPWAEAPAAPRAAADAGAPQQVATPAEAMPAAAAASAVHEAEPQPAVIETMAAVTPAVEETPAAAAPAEPQRAAEPSPPRRTAKPAKRAAPTAPRRETRLAKATPAQKDPDVDLLEALVSHVAGKEAAAAGRIRVADAGTPPAATRDVVLQQEPALPTAELVRRCMTLGWLESQLCRARICTGQWGADPACPSTQQQSAEFRR